MKLRMVFQVVSNKNSGNLKSVDFYLKNLENAFTFFSCMQGICLKKYENLALKTSLSPKTVHHESTLHTSPPLTASFETQKRLVTRDISLFDGSKGPMFLKTNLEIKQGWHGKWWFQAIHVLFSVRKWPTWIYLKVKIDGTNTKRYL